MASIVTTQEDYANGTLTQSWMLYDDGTVTLEDGQGQVVATVPPTADTLALAQQIGTTRVVETNTSTLQAKATAAIDANVAWLAGHATRQAQIDALIADATTGKSATITNVAQAQAVSRALADGLLRAARGLDNLETLLQSAVKQLTAMERLLVDQLDSTDGT